MATLTDEIMFGQLPPGVASVAAFWKQADAARSTLLKSQRGFFRRLWVRINPRSLLPMANAVSAPPKARVTPTKATPAPPEPTSRALVDDTIAIAGSVRAKRTMSSATGGR
jgi:hypothetical protein